MNVPKSMKTPVAKALGTFGATVESIIAVIDRCEGARENIESAGYQFVSLFTTQDLGIVEATA